MALTKIGTDGVKDDAITSGKIPANAVGSSEIADQAVTLDKLPHGTSSNDGKFLRANNGADPSFETVDLANLNAASLTSGTIPDARFPATLPAVSAANLTNLPASGKVANLIINGAMQVAQRGTSHTSSGYRTIDRFKMSAGNASATLTQAQVDVTAGVVDPRHYGFHKCMKITNNGQSANTQGYCYLEQSIEGQNIVQSGWRFGSSSSYITVSFWVRASVAQNYLFSVYAHGGTAKEYNWIESLSANVWTKITKTIPGDSNVSIPNSNSFGLSIYFHAYLGSHYTSGSTVNQWVTHAGYTSRPDMDSTWWTTGNSTYEITGVQIEAGNSASPFAHESYYETKLKCKRYCHVLASGQYTVLGVGMQYYSGYIFVDTGPIDMRATPTMVAKSGSSGAYVYETYFGNSPAYTHQISLDSKTKKDRALISVLGNSTRHSEAVRVSTHAITLNNNEPFVFLDAEL